MRYCPKSNTLKFSVLTIKKMAKHLLYFQQVNKYSIKYIRSRVTVFWIIKGEFNKTEFYISSFGIFCGYLTAKHHLNVIFWLNVTRIRSTNMGIQKWLWLEMLKCERKSWKEKVKIPSEMLNWTKCFTLCSHHHFSIYRTIWSCFIWSLLCL